MQLTSQQTISAPLQHVWNALNDTDILQACIPGCEALTATDANTFELQILAAIGPVKAKFKGKLTLADLQPPASYTIKFEGQGGAAGHGKGTAQVRLEALSVNETTLHYTATATVGGKIAQIGQRLVDMAAQRMATEFFSNFNTALLPQAGDDQSALLEPAASHDEPKTGLFARLTKWWRNMFARNHLR